MINYLDVVEKFVKFLKANGYNSRVVKNSFLAGFENEKFNAASIVLPYFNYDKIRETDFFNNQENYDLSICTTNDQKGKIVVKIDVLLKNVNSLDFCEQDQFPVILTKINSLKERFFYN